MENKFKISTISDVEFNEFAKEVLAKISNSPSFYNIVLNEGFNAEDILKYPSKFIRAYESFELNENNKTYALWKKNINKKFMNVLYKDYDGRPELKSVEYNGYKQIVNYSLNFIYNDGINIEEIFEYNLDSLLKEEVIKKLKESILKNKWIYIKGSKEILNDQASFAAINEYLKSENKKIAVIDSLNTFKDLYLKFKDNIEEFNKFIDLLISADIVYIKNFAKEMPTKIIRDEFLVKFLEKMNFLNGKTIIFSSDLSLNKACSKYIFKDGSMLEAKTIYDLISINLLNKKEIEYINI